jgi:hypothetical protein
MTSETRALRNEILANLLDLPLTQEEKGIKVGLSWQMVSYVFKNIGLKNLFKTQVPKLI